MESNKGTCVSLLTESRPRCEGGLNRNAMYESLAEWKGPRSLRFKPYSNEGSARDTFD